MKKEIIKHINNAPELERLYQVNKHAFKKAFDELYPSIKNEKTAEFWLARLHYTPQTISWGTNKELILIGVLAFLAGCIAKIPDFSTIDPENFFIRNISFVVFPSLIAYFGWKNNIKLKTILAFLVPLIVSLIYINLLPDKHHDTTILSCIHLPLFLWTILGISFMNAEYKNLNKRIDFLKFNGDLIVITALILISGGILTGLTFGLFELIEVEIEQFYTEYVFIWGLPSAPIIGAYLVRSNPQLVNKVSPIIAKIFTPLLFIMLSAYLIAMIGAEKNPFNDRDFLIIFNSMLIGVMAIILFSVIETVKNTKGKAMLILLFLLSIVTIVVNITALSAIIFRLFQWGITPNRMAVTGGNILILIHLVLVAFRLFKSVQNMDQLKHVKTTIAQFLPVYALWIMVVTFLFPLLFGFT